MIPPRPAVIAHDKVLRVVENDASKPKWLRRNVRLIRTLARWLRRARVDQSLACLSRLHRGADQTNISPRHSDKGLPFPYCYGFLTDNRLVKRRLRAHRRRFARRPVSKTALVLRSWASRAT